MRNDIPLGQSATARLAGVDEFEQMTVSALGARVQVRLSGPNAPDVAADLRERWSRCLLDDEPVPGAASDLPSSELARVLSYRTDARGVADDSLRRRITTDVTAAGLDHCRGRVLTLHAAGLEDGDRVYGFVGPSGAGKSTLASRLGRDLGYAGDEAIGIDGENRLIAFPKPLSLHLGPEREKDQVAPDALGLLPAVGDLPLAGLFLLDRHDNLVEPATTPVPLIEALVALARQTSYLPSLDRPLQRLAALVRDVGVYRLAYRESAAALPVIRAAASAPIEPIWDWSVPANVTLGPAPEDAPAVRRVPARDAVVDAEGTVAVLKDTDLHVLSPLGSAVWELSAEWTSIRDLERELARLTGAQPAPGQVEDRLRELALTGLVTLRP